MMKIWYERNGLSRKKRECGMGETIMTNRRKVAPERKGIGHSTGGEI
jgi:hypothetical protein